MSLGTEHFHIFSYQFTIYTLTLCVFSKQDYSSYVGERRGSETFGPSGFAKVAPDPIGPAAQPPTYEDRINSVLRYYRIFKHSC